jgi:xyloglucan-specific exo-beta-1,4-glucanase
MHTTSLARLLICGILASGIVSSTKSPSASAQSTSQLYTWRGVNIGGGGYVPGIVYNQTEAGLVYARTDIGGAYRLESDGRWTPLLDWLGWDDWNLTGVDSLATDPVTPDRLYVLAGTYTNEWTSQNGAILRSTDRGETFERIDLPFKSGGNMPGRGMGERLAIDPNKNSVLYLGARSGNGLWRSTDFGSTWSKVTSFPNAGTYFESAESSYTSDLVGVVWVTFDTTTGSSGNATQTIYVGVADKATSVYRSTDGGDTWAAVPGQPTGFLPHHGVLASTGALYISYSDGAGPYDGGKGDVWKYATATGTWTRISPVPSTSGDDYYGYGGLAVDAQQPDTLVVAALNSWWPDTIMFRSTNGGASWTPIWQWGSWPNRILRYTQDITGAPWLTFGGPTELPVLSPKLGWMVGDLEIDPFNRNRLLYGTGATIYGTDNLTDWDGDNAINITVRAQGLEETNVQDLISPPSGAPLLSALGDLGGFRHGNLTAPTMMFTNPTFTTGTSLDYAERNPAIIWRTGTGGSGGSNVAYSLDAGITWKPAAQPAGASGGVIAVSSNGKTVVWSASSGPVRYSMNIGASWTPSSGIPDGAQVAADRVNPSKFYGFSDGAFYVSVDDGHTFAVTAAAGLPASARFKAAPDRQGHIWLAGSGPGGTYGLWHSADSGQTFTRLATVEEADNVGFGKAAPGQKYMALYSSAKIGGVRGIYRSIDQGTSWTRVNDDQHQYGFTGQAITGDPRVYGRVYISTNGRGIIYGDPQ